MPTSLISPQHFRKLILRSIIPPLVLAALVAALLIAQITSLVSATRWVDHTDAVIVQANGAYGLIMNAAAGERGYFIGGNPTYLVSYRQSSPKIGPSLDRLADLVADNPVQARQVSIIRAGCTRWEQKVQNELFLYEQGRDYRTAFIQSNEKNRLDLLRAEFAQFVKTETTLRSERVARARRATAISLGATLISLPALGLLLAATFRRQITTLIDQYQTALTSTETALTSAEQARLSAENARSATERARQLLSATLLGIGDAVLVTDTTGRVTLLNAVAERLTGWTSEEAQGQDSHKVFRIINERTREKVKSPVERVLRESVVVGLANHTLLVRRDGAEIPIDDSGAPVWESPGRLAGVVLVFRDVTWRRAGELALEAALRQEHTITATLQRSLLQMPVSDAFPGLSIGTVYEPARLDGDSESVEVGGDFLDAFALSESRVALVVGDVSGKGLIAASRTAEVRYTLRGLLREYDSPAMVMARLNSIICNSQYLNGEAEGFVCLALAIVDTTRKTAHFCVAGAEPPLIIRMAGGVDEVALTGTPLGVYDKAEYEAGEVALAAGDIVTMATDGISEARHEKEFLGYEGLVRLTIEASGLPTTTDIAQAILSGAKEFSGGSLRDDAAILVSRLQ